MRTFLSDLRFALRVLAKAPGFTAAAILSLALGIGANATVFTWTDHLLREPLPGVPRSGELVVVVNSDSGSPGFDMSHADFLDLSRETRTLQAMSASRWSTLNLGEQGAAERIYGQVVSGGFFRVLRLRPALGRLLDADDDHLGAPQNVVLSHAFWQRRFAGQASVLGRALRINGVPRTVVGVAPEGFEGTLGGLAFDVWLPLAPQMRAMDDENVLTDRRNRCFYVMARPAKGCGLAQVQGELAALGGELERRYPGENRGMKVKVLPISRSTQGVQSIAAQPLAILAIAVGLVLLIACVNVANLILARGSGRERELAIRQALGAGRGRLVRQLMTESLVLGLGGGTVGWVASMAGTSLLQSLAPPTYLPLVLRGGASGGSLVFAFALSLLASLAIGLVPALRSSSVRAGALKDGARGSVGPRMRRLQGALVVAQVALAVMLLAGAGLLVKSFRNTRRADPGFDARQVLVAGFGLENTGYTREKTAQVGKAFLEQVRSLPGVQAAAMSQELIMGLEGASWDYFQIEGRDEDPRERLRLFRNLVSPGFFRTLGIPVVAGRDFSELDRSDTQPVVVVNEALARKYWPGADPLGKRLRTGGRLWTVAGVCRSTRGRTWTDPVTPFVYFPSAQAGDDGCHILYVRSAEALSTLQPALAGALRGVDPDLPLLMEPLERILDSAAWTIALAAKVLGALGLLALVLAGVGIYGVVATSVGQRIPEFGIRMSLGADPWRILGLVLGQGGRLVALGLVLGIPAALALSQGLSTLLMGVDPMDPFIFVGVPAILAFVAFLACALPGLRASRVNPLQALRQE